MWWPSAGPVSFLLRGLLLLTKTEHTCDDKLRSWETVSIRKKVSNLCTPNTGKWRSCEVVSEERNKSRFLRREYDSWLRTQQGLSVHHYNWNQWQLVLRCFFKSTENVTPWGWAKPYGFYESNTNSTTWSVPTSKTTEMVMNMKIQRSRSTINIKWSRNKVLGSFLTSGS